jgi:periplasmic protein TonB
MLEELEQQETTQEQLVVPRLEIAPPAPVLVENDQRQRRRMVIALVMLLVALGLVLVKDRDFWFAAPEATESEAIDDSAPAAADETAQPAASANATATPLSPNVRKKHPTPPAGRKTTEPAPPPPPAVVASRAVLPPLRVEVVAGGDQRQLVHPGIPPAVKVELQNGAPGKIASEPTRATTEVPDPTVITGRGERVEMSTDTRQALTRPVRPEYPLLARQMKVQGQVVLSVFIDKDGSIENLQIVSGPAILADAARAAVKQWRFKPYLQNGVPVATQARVTVAFTIGVAN